MIESTFAMIKPDAIRAGHVGGIISMIEKNNFRLIRLELMELTVATAQRFYAVHQQRPFFNELVQFITSGPVIAMILERENGIIAWRTLMGATNPLEAASDTVRKNFATSIGENAVHGSDSPETAKQEIELIFPTMSI